MANNMRTNGIGHVGATGTAVEIDSVGMQFQSRTGSVLALDDINLAVEQGEFICVVGPSGCGKTTLLRLVQGLDTPTSGTVRVASGAPGIGESSFVFQRASLLPWQSVRRNVSFGLDLRAYAAKHGARLSRAERARIVDDLLELTDLTDFADYYPWQISGGMQQRANLARALAVEPSVLLMDEPFSALDAMTRERLQRDVHAIVDTKRTTTIFITHDIREAVFLADRVVIMTPRPGRIAGVVRIDEPRPRGAEFQNSERLASISLSIWRTLNPE